MHNHISSLRITNLITIHACCVALRNLLGSSITRVLRGHLPLRYAGTFTLLRRQTSIHGTPFRCAGNFNISLRQLVSAERGQSRRALRAEATQATNRSNILFRCAETPHFGVMAAASDFFVFSSVRQSLQV